ncbi:PEP-CTERM sorting domain-containing protein [Roseateles sp. P5_D6]
MNLQRFIFALALVLGLSPIAAKADTAIQASTCASQTSFRCVTGIKDLLILGQHYDLTVSVGKFSELFVDPDHQLASWADSNFANAAMLAITSTLNGQLGVTSADTKFFDVGRDPRYETILHLPVAYDYFNGNPQGAFQGACAVLDASAVLTGQCSIWLTNETVAFAVFAPAAAAVPEPGTWWLAALGVLLLCGLAKRGDRGRAQ